MTIAFKVLPNNYLKEWGEFESWSLGVGSAPDGWLVGSSFLVGSDATNKKYGDYGAYIVGSGGTGVLYRSVPSGSDYAGRTFKLGFWAKCSSTAPYAQLFDGVNESTVHMDGLNAFAEFTTPILSLDPNATELTVKFFATTGATMYLDSAVLVQGDKLFTAYNDNIVLNRWQPALNMRADSYEVAGREGSIMPESHLTGRVINASGSVVGSDVVSCRTHFEQLMQSIVDWRRDEKRSMYVNDDRVFDCLLSSFNWDYLNGMKYIRFNMRLSAPEATSRSLNMYRHRQVISASVTEFNLSYGGNEVSKPFISFVADQGGAITTCNLENLTLGENMVYTGTVPSGVSLDVDCFKGSVLASDVDSISNFGGSDFVGIVPGTNYFKFSGSNCTILIDYFYRYL